MSKNNNENDHYRPIVSSILAIIMTILSSFEINIITGIEFNAYYIISLSSLLMATVLSLYYYLKVSKAEHYITYLIASSAQSTNTEIEKIKDRQYNPMKVLLRTVTILICLFMLIGIPSFIYAKRILSQSDLDIKTASKEVQAKLNKNIEVLINKIESVDRMNNNISELTDREKSVLIKMDELIYDLKNLTSYPNQQLKSPVIGNKAFMKEIKGN